MFTVPDKNQEAFRTAMGLMGLAETMRSNDQNEAQARGDDLYRAEDKNWKREMMNQSWLGKLLFGDKGEDSVDGTIPIPGLEKTLNEQRIKLSNGLDMGTSGGTGPTYEQQDILNQMRNLYAEGDKGKLQPQAYNTNDFDRQLMVMAPSGQGNALDIMKGKGTMNDTEFNTMKQYADKANADKENVYKTVDKNREIGDSLKLMPSSEDYKGDGSDMRNQALDRYEQLFQWAVKNGRDDVIPEIAQAYKLQMENIDKHWNKQDYGNKYNFHEGYGKDGKGSKTFEYQYDVYDGNQRIGSVPVVVSAEQINNGKARELANKLAIKQYGSKATLGSGSKTGTGIQESETRAKVDIDAQEKMKQSLAENKDINEADLASGFGAEKAYRSGSFVYFQYRNNDGSTYVSKVDAKTGKSRQVGQNEIPGGAGMVANYGGGNTNSAGASGEKKKTTNDKKIIDDLLK